MSRLRIGGVSVLIALTLLAPVAVGAVVTLRAASESPLESASNTEPLIGTVESAERFSDASVAIAVEYADALSPATNAAGTLTELRIGPGSRVETGNVVAEVNNQLVVAYASESPLWRDISRGVDGADVRVAQQLLANLGFKPGKVDGKTGFYTERAIKAFNKKYGYGKDNGVLSLASLVWVGVNPVTVDEMKVVLGDSVSPGTPLFTTTAGLAAITVSETPNVPRDAEVNLVLDDIVAPYEPGTGRITDPEPVAAIAESLGTATEGVATVRLASPVRVGTVPSSAVVTDESGTACIFADPTSAAVVVEPLAGTLGTVDLDPALIGQPVLINPREVRADLTCGS